VSNEEKVKAVVIYVRPDGEVLIERPGMDPVLIVAAERRAPEHADAPIVEAREGGDITADPDGEPYIVPTADPVFLFKPLNAILPAKTPAK
jgi:hypothetical protein